MSTKQSKSLKDPRRNLNWISIQNRMRKKNLLLEAGTMGNTDEIIME